MASLIVSALEMKTLLLLRMLYIIFFFFFFFLLHTFHQFAIELKLFKDNLQNDFNINSRSIAYSAI